MSTTNPAMIDPRSVLSPDELAAAHANVERAPRLAPAQLDIVAAIFRPHVRQALAGHHRAA